MNKLLIIEELKARGLNFEVHPVIKNGVTKTGITDRSKGDCCPTFYLEDFSDCREEEIADKIIKAFEAAPVLSITGSDDVMKLVTRSNLRARICAKGNVSDDTITIPFLDMEIYAVVVVDELFDDGCGGTTKMTKGLFEAARSSGNFDIFTEEELIKVAVENSTKDIESRPIVEMILEMMKAGGRSIPEDIEAAFKEDAKMHPMNVLSNSKYENGAVAILCNDELDKVCESFNTEKIYIFPSSIHEVICTPMIEDHLEYFKVMVSDINNTEVKPEEKLTDSVYVYNSTTKNLEVA